VSSEEVKDRLRAVANPTAPSLNPRPDQQERSTMLAALHTVSGRSAAPRRARSQNLFATDPNLLKTPTGTCHTLVVRLINAHSLLSTSRKAKIFWITEKWDSTTVCLYS